jgi:hypothetical protein
MSDDDTLKLNGRFDEVVGFKDLKVRVRPVFRDVDRLLTDRDDFERNAS